MGEARKRRRALIKAGRPEVAATQFYPPSRLIEQKFLSDPKLDEAITERFERTRRDQVPTRSVFLELLLRKGLDSFDAFYKKEQAAEPEDSLIAQPTTKQVVQLG